MGFRCDSCSNAVMQSPTKRVVAVRPKEYAERVYKQNAYSVIDPGGFGEEIAREENWCSACAQRDVVDSE